MELVTSAHVVCLSRPQVAALPHVCYLIASRLAPPKSWTIETAIRNGCTHLARHLLDELAENPNLHYLTKRSRARQLLSVAASVGDLALMEHLVECFDCCVDDSAFVNAVKGGHLAALQWLYSRALAGSSPGEEVQSITRKVLPVCNMGLASRSGNLEVLQWMQPLTGRVPVTPVLLEAARHGHLHILEWVLPMPKKPKTDTTDAPLIKAVAECGSIEVAKLLLSKTVLSLTPELMDAAAHYGQLGLLHWLHDNDGEDCTARAINDAARNGHLDVVQWLHSKGFHCSRFAMDGAAGNGHLAVVKFLHEYGSEGCTQAAFRSAVNNGHLDVAQFLLSEHQLVDCSAAVSIDKVARHGGLEMLQWIQSNGLTTECTVEAMAAAAANGHLDVVRFLHENRNEGCTTGAMDRAAKKGHLEIVKFLHNNRREGCTTDAMDQAAANGHLDVIKFLHEFRTEGCTTEAMDYADNVEILRWLGKHRREGFTSRVLHHAAFHGDLEAIVWLHGHAPAEMWTPALVKDVAWRGQVEILEWLADNVPGLVDASALLSSRDQKTWWVSAWLKQRVES